MVGKPRRSWICPTLTAKRRKGSCQTGWECEYELPLHPVSTGPLHHTGKQEAETFNQLCHDVALAFAGPLFFLLTTLKEIAKVSISMSFWSYPQIETPSKMPTAATYREWEQFPSEGSNVSTTLCAPTSGSGLRQRTCPLRIKIYNLKVDSVVKCIWQGPLWAQMTETE